jgi:hypothetical protein
MAADELMFLRCWSPAFIYFHTGLKFRSTKTCSLMIYSARNEIFESKYTHGKKKITFPCHRLSNSIFGQLISSNRINAVTGDHVSLAKPICLSVLHAVVSFLIRQVHHSVLIPAVLHFRLMLFASCPALFIIAESYKLFNKKVPSVRVIMSFFDTLLSKCFKKFVIDTPDILFAKYKRQ